MDVVSVGGGAPGHATPSVWCVKCFWSIVSRISGRRLRGTCAPGVSAPSKRRN